MLTVANLHRKQTEQKHGEIDCPRLGNPEADAEREFGKMFMGQMPMKGKRDCRIGKRERS